MVIASYRDQAAYEAAAGEVGAIFEEMSMHLTVAPHGHDGTVVFSMDV
jgi:hypothetical protein